MLLTDRPAWNRLCELNADYGARPTLNRANPAVRFEISVGGLTLDYSRQAIDTAIVDALAALADEVDLHSKIVDLYRGAAVNHTEGRAALHTALRSRSEAALEVHGQDIRPAIHNTLNQMAGIAELVEHGRKVQAPDAIHDIISIGIGGSHLGPELVYSALSADCAQGPRLHFVANVDPRALNRVLAVCDPQHTLTIVTSKTFTTQETLSNARAARQWYRDQGIPEAGIQSRFMAITANPQAAHEFGIQSKRILGFWDWVGGRYSLWSSVGLPIVLALGSGCFRRLLAGAETVDRHFIETPWQDNVPALLGLLGIWHVNMLDYSSLAVIPYSERLSLLPAYLQQLDMESNGKRVNRAGEVLPYATGPVIWGTAGTLGQHAYFQHLHQSPQVTPVDLVLPLLPAPGDAIDAQDLLVANCLAQAEAFHHGQGLATTRELLRTQGLSSERIDTLAPHRVFPGRRPVNLIAMERLTPENLGALIAIYEHKVFTQSVLWDINPFDQWGVELGKQIANNIVPCLRKPGALPGKDQSDSLATWIERYRQIRPD